MAYHDRGHSLPGSSPDNLHGNSKDDTHRRGPELNAAILAFRQKLRANKPQTLDSNDILLDNAYQSPRNTVYQSIEPHETAGATIEPLATSEAISADLSLLNPSPILDQYTSSIAIDSHNEGLQRSDTSERSKDSPDLVESEQWNLSPPSSVIRNTWAVRPPLTITFKNQTTISSQAESEDGKSRGSAKSSCTEPSTSAPDADECSRVEHSSQSCSIGRAIVTPLCTPSARISATTLTMGYFQTEELMIDMKTVQSSEWSVLLEVNFFRKELALFAPFLSAVEMKNPAARNHKLRTPLGNILKICELCEVDGAFALVISLSKPPEVNRRSNTHVWERVSNIAANPQVASASPIALHQINQVDFGRWTVYKVIFPRQAQDDWANLRKSLIAYRVNIQRGSTVQCIRGWASNLWSWLDKSSSSKLQGSLSLLGNTEDFHFPFEVRYLLEACISLGVLHESNISADFLRKLQEFTQTAMPNSPSRAASILEYIAIQGKRYYKPMDIFEDKNVTNYWPERKLPEYCCVVRKAIVTPTTVYFSSPSVETTYRLLRKHMHFSDRFLRVQFLDELHKGKVFSKVWENDKDNQTVIWDRISHTFRHGIRIGNRTYRFLAYGNSQLREHSALFYCDEPSLTREMIWRLMGDFSHIRVAAKYAARMGQCLTTTRQPRNLSFSANIINIPDIEKGQWCFSDGVGKIGRHLADEIAKRLKLSGRPSAFQFRLGGSKGLVVVWDKIGWNEIHLRPSQIKFQALDKSLEVIKTARTAATALNRQTITILSHLGVSDAVFMKMLRTQLDEYKDAMEDTTVAERVLRDQSDENEVQATMAGMIANGFMRAQDPFMMALLGLWRTWSLQYLKHKGRLLVKKGAFVFGALDETGTLEGHSSSSQEKTLPQIFLQIPRGRRYQVVRGLCIVGRNPTLHPGDIRLVEAVDIPDLRHIHDVVVFPAQGDRDIPSMCSGGDLDGDEFFVIWDEDLVGIRQEEPSLETIHAAKDLGRDVAMDDVAEFFVDFMKNDSIGVIAHAHLAMADRFGPNHPNCIELATLHSKSVDFNKTGIPAKMKRHLQVRKFPHFMGKSDDRSYHSDSILGQVYDAVVEIDFQPEYTKPFDPRVLDAYSLDDEIVDRAAKLKIQYDKSLQAIMRQHSITTEFEVWTTFVLTRPVVGSDFKIQEKLGEVRSALFDQYRIAAYEAVGSRETAKILPFASACYRATHEELQRALRDSKFAEEEPSHHNMPFISFPWIFEHELGMIIRSAPRAEDNETAYQQADHVISMMQESPIEQVKVDEYKKPRSQAGQELLLAQEGSGKLVQQTGTDELENEDIEEDSDSEDGGGMDAFASS